MIFDNVEFYNVAELEKVGDEYIMWRVPKDVRNGLELLSNPAYISQDMAHPSVWGMEELSNNWFYHLSALLGGL